MGDGIANSNAHLTLLLRQHVVENGVIQGLLGKLRCVRDLVQILGDVVHPLLGAQVERGMLPVFGRVAIRELLVLVGHRDKVEDDLLGKLVHSALEPEPVSRARRQIRLMV